MRLDSFPAGLVMGLLVPVLGFFIYGVIHTTLIRPHLDLQYFIHDLFLGTRQFQAPILSLSLIANLGIFLLLNRLDMPEAMRGVLTATFLYGVVIVVLWF
jgi:hypothetical protein